eukprot:7102021-Prymnesium_polylepis.1
MENELMEGPLGKSRSLDFRTVECQRTAASVCDSAHSRSRHATVHPVAELPGGTKYSHPPLQELRLLVI